MSTPLSGKVQTVLGAITSERLGITLPHEHCYMDLSSRFSPPTEATLRNIAYQPVSLENRWFINYNATANMDNLKLDDEAVITDEVQRFKKAGGKSIVDMSNIGLGRDPRALAALSRITGVNLVMGSGHYVETSVPGGLDMDEGEIVDRIVKDVLEGVGDTGVCAGLIGEIGCSWPVTTNEQKSLRAAARAQHKTGAPINFHPGFSPDAVFLGAKVLDDAGADLSRIAISHVEARVFSHQKRVELARMGFFLEFDLFGVEGYQRIRMVYSEDNPKPAHMPNDGDRVEMIMALVDAGFADRILVSHDICTKHRLCRYGGHGYAHILLNAVPLMREKGLDEASTHGFLVKNPARLLTFA
ncbi:MAG: aryldialkylphosphatase [Dehalococcoidia bacterium]|nr:aryldialkylphosphatase [Dehalococcoidia bacterium]